MDLKIKDIVELFNVPEKTIIQWIKERGMPSHKIKNQYFFNKAAVSEWILSSNIAVSENISNLSLTNKPVSISKLIKKGGVFHNIQGNTIGDIIGNIADVINIPEGLTKETVKASLLQREELMSTAVGNGIAFPHPRNPIISDIDEEGISICFLAHRINYNAMDKKPVGILFIIISSNAKRHLEILSKISFLCRDEDFIRLLQGEPGTDELYHYIDIKEKEWA